VDKLPHFARLYVCPSQSHVTDGMKPTCGKNAMEAEKCCDVGDAKCVVPVDILCRFYISVTAQSDVETRSHELGLSTGLVYSRNFA